MVNYRPKEPNKQKVTFVSLGWKGSESLVEGSSLEEKMGCCGLMVEEWRWGWGIKVERLIWMKLETFSKDSSMA